MHRLWPFLLLILLLCACSQTPPPVKPAAQEKPLTIAFVYKTLSNPYFISMSEGAKRAAKEENIILVEKSCNNEEQFNEQIAIMQELIALKVSGICLAPISPFKLIEVSKQLEDPDIWNDAARAQELGKEKKTLQALAPNSAAKSFKVRVRDLKTYF